MKFHSIEIDAFGVLSGTVLNGLENRLSVVYGPNGSGKTTLLHFLRGLFCGYSDARRRGLLPANHGEPGGGALGVQWKGNVCRFQRAENADADNKLRITLIQNGRQTTHPSFTSQHLPSDQIPLLYAVEHADVHAIDRLVRMALQDGIDLVTQQDGIDLATQQDNPDRLTAAASEVHTQQSQLVDSDRGRIVELSQQRRRLQEELRQIKTQVQERCRLVTEEQQTRQENESGHWRQRSDWLHSELQAAESDLREAEESAWQRDHQASAEMRKRTAPTLRLRRIPSTSHVEVNHREQLEDIDRRTAAARLRLAEIAKALLEVNLRAAHIAGSPELPTEEFLEKLRESLSVMEDSLLELQEDAERLDTAPARHECVCEKWSSSTQTAAEDVRRRLYRTCAFVSQFEMQLLETQLNAEASRLDQDRQAQLRELQSLQDQRQQLMTRTGRLAVWRGPAQQEVGQDLCRCSEHEGQEGLQDTTCERHPVSHWENSRQEPDSSSHPQTTVRSQMRHRVSGQDGSTPQTTEAPATAVKEPRPRSTRANVWPTEEELTQLGRRRHQLQIDLDEARREWRKQRSCADRHELPDDIRKLEQQADRKQLELDAVEQELTDSHQQWRVLSVTGEVIRRIAERDERNVRTRCLQWAGEYLSRLTAGRYVNIRVTPDHHDVRIVDESGSERPRWALSRGTLDQVALSLRLALVREYAERGVRFPLVFDDVLVDCDIERLQEAVRLLKEYAAEHDQQILYLTCGSHLVSLFESEGVSLQTMPETKHGSSGSPRPVEHPPNWSVRGWVDRFAAQQETASEKATDADDPQRDVNPQRGVNPQRAWKQDDSTSASEPIIEKVQTAELSSPPSVSHSDRDGGGTPRQRRQPGGPYWLSVDSPLVLVPSIGEQMGRRLSALGIRTVSELLELAAEESSIPLRSLQIDVRRFREWQAEALLLSCVPDLTGPDAQILVACSVHDPRQLAESDVAQLINQLDRYARRNLEPSLRAELPTREDLQQWIHNGRRSRSLADARKESHRGRQTRRDGVVSHRMASQADRSTVSGDQRKESSEPDRAVVARFPSATKSSSSSKSAELRFYLSPENLVVDAPSIGTKMASLLKTVGIVSVGDLLTRKPAQVAERLNHRRVKTETVTVWQQQAQLMCRIPQLRGHDAQVLVACDITEPEQVARLDARSLFAIVDSFVETKEGRRLMRSSKTPDLEEVAEWIQWANQARPLRAA